MLKRRIIRYILLGATAMALCLYIGRVAVLAQESTYLQIFLPFIQTGADSQTEVSAPQLFGEEVQTASNEGSPEVIRERRAKVNIDFLGSSGKLGRRQTINDEIVLNLFEDRQYVAQRIRTEPLSDGGYAWVGEIPEIAFSQVTIIVRDGLLTGNIRLPSGLYQLRPSDDEEFHIITEVDGSIFNEVEDDTIPAPYEETLQLAGDGVADDGSVIDVMVVYGSAAMQAAGGPGAMENLIDLGFTETNAAYENSGVKFRIRKVHTYQTNYTSSGSGSTDIDRLRLPNDGFMDEIHALRDLYGADLVSLWLEDGSCGIGYVKSFAGSAFTVVNRKCATGNLTFGHEIGHNMGALHDWYADDSMIDNITYNHGYVNISGGEAWRTIMAYNALCDAQGFYCARLTQISNPDIMVSGMPSGVPAGTNSNCVAGDPNNPPCDSYNTQLLNDRAFVVANFRSSVAEAAPVDTATATPIDTLTSTPTNTATNIPTNTPILTPTDMPTSTNMPMPTATNTPVDTPTATDTPTNIPVNTATPTAIDTPTSTLISTSTPTNTPVATVAPIAVNAPASISIVAPSVEDFALADIAGAGRVRLSFHRTHKDDGRVQSVRERLGGTNRWNRTNYLVHTWQFNVTGGDKVTFYANAFSSSSRDGDTFIFSYSTDQENYTDLFSVSRGDRNVLKSAALPDAIQGTVYIRVADSDQTRGQSNRDRVYVDYLSIHSESTVGE